MKSFYPTRLFAPTFAAKQLAPKQIIGSFASGERPQSGVYSSAVSLSLPRHNTPSKYDSSWEPYIAANVLLYAVPLAIFLRRARELDFSNNKFDYSVRLVERVFRVFSAPVMDAVARHLSTAGNISMGSLGTTSIDKLSLLVQQHFNQVGNSAPPSGPLSLESCQSDMHGLLEEIYMQHMKKVRDLDVVGRMAASLEGLFGTGVVSGEEKELTTLVERAKLIVRLPVDYEVIPGSGTTTQSGRAGAQPAGLEKQHVRAKDGKLTPHGIESILRGETKCRPADVSYQGDNMRAGVGSHEIPLLVTFTIWLSDYLNTKLGLAAGDQEAVWWKRNLRVNVRFLADYRHLLFLFGVYVVFRLGLRGH